MKILVFNVGSSSVKFALFTAAATAALSPAARGQVTADESAGSLRATVAGESVTHQWSLTDSEWLPGFFEWLEDRFGAPDMVGHRIVHGGRRFRRPAVLDTETLSALDEIAPLAPLHLPPAIALVRRVAACRPALRQAGCFDTTFHATLPEQRRHFALPPALADTGVVRYGFHGLSYENVAKQAPAVFGAQTANGRLVALHLGSGASACGMVGCESQATTMGMTPLDGLVMATRCGSLDAGVVLHLIQHLKMSPDEVEKLLTKESGLRGISGISDDIRALIVSDKKAAAMAITMFCESAARHAAALACDIGGIDALSFSGGIGENNPAIRRDICERLKFLGVELDATANETTVEKAVVISAANSAVAVAVIPADEETLIADALRQSRWGL